VVDFGLRRCHLVLAAIDYFDLKSFAEFGHRSLSRLSLNSNENNDNTFLEETWLRREEDMKGWHVFFSPKPHFF